MAGIPSLEETLKGASLAHRIEWRFVEDSLIGVGHWYLHWGDPVDEQCVTLSQVIHLIDNAVWCLREHCAILGRIVAAAEDVLGDLGGLRGVDGEPAQLGPGSPMEHTVQSAMRAVQHALALLVDAMVEHRKGPVERALLEDPRLAAELAFATAEAINCAFRLSLHLQH